MKTTSLSIIVAFAAFAGITHAEGAKPNKAKKEITPEQLEKYDTDKDGKLSKDEKVLMRKDKVTNPRADGKGKGVSAEKLEMYDKDKDGKLSKEERVEMRKDKAIKPNAGKKKKKDAVN